MANPLQNTDSENLAAILQNLVKATKELRQDNSALHDRIQELSSQLLTQQHDGNAVDGPQRRKKRKTASKECQVLLFV